MKCHMGDKDVCTEEMGGYHTGTARNVQIRCNGCPYRRCRSCGRKRGVFKVTDSGRILCCRCYDEAKAEEFFNMTM